MNTSDPDEAYSKDAGYFCAQLAYQPPYAWEELLAFLVRRAIPGVEAVEANRYRRCVSLEQKGRRVSGWVSVSHNAKRCCLEVQLSDSLEAVSGQVLTRLKYLFDCECVPGDVAAVLGPLADSPAGLRVAGAFNGFEVAVRAILGQQITVSAATTLAGRLASAYGETMRTQWSSLRCQFPSAARLAAVPADELGRLGIIRSRQAAIKALAEACASADLVLAPSVASGPIIKQLLALPGVGDWTAQYIAMRALHHPDAWPYSDHAVKKWLGLTSKRQLQAAADSWRPVRSYATMYIWQTLSKRQNASG